MNQKTLFWLLGAAFSVNLFFAGVVVSLVQTSNAQVHEAIVSLRTDLVSHENLAGHDRHNHPLDDGGLKDLVQLYIVDYLVKYPKEKYGDN